MQTKIVVCLLVWLLVFHRNCGSDEVDSSPMGYEEIAADKPGETMTDEETDDYEPIYYSSEEKFDDGVVWEESDMLPEATTTAPQAPAKIVKLFLNAGRDSSEEKKEEAIAETSAVAGEENEIGLMPDDQQEEDEEENNYEPSQTTEATTTPAPDQMDDFQSWDHFEEQTTTTVEMKDEPDANVPLTGGNEGSEDWTKPEEEDEELTFPPTTATDLNELNAEEPPNVAPKRDAMDSSTSELDLVLDQVEQWQSELNQSIATVSSHIFDLIAEQSRIQENLNAAMSTDESAENEILTPQSKRLLVGHYQLMFLTQQQSLLKRSLEQMKRCSALISNFIQCCETMSDDLSNFADLLSIVEKLKVSLPILRQYPTSTDAIVENERILDELNADVLRCIA